MVYVGGRTLQIELMELVSFKKPSVLIYKTLFLATCSTLRMADNLHAHPLQRQTVEVASEVQCYSLY